MMNDAVCATNRLFPLTERDPGEYRAFKAPPLSVHLEWYGAEGLGNASLLRGKAMAGLMKMETLVINATERDLPLLSCDYIAALGKHTLLIEYYDTLLDPGALDTAPLSAVKASVSGLPDHDLGAHWYDSLKLPGTFSKRVRGRELPVLTDSFTAALHAYLTLAQSAPLLSPERRAQKREKAKAYVDGLLQNGGPSTDAFRKALGAERTADLFSRIVFGTADAKA